MRLYLDKMFVSLTIYLFFSDIPTLVQVQEPWQKMYLGTSIGKGICTHFDMVHLKKVPSHCKYLTGMNTVLKRKV